MNKQSFWIGAIAVGMIGGAGLFLFRVQGFQKLGVPGVKIVREPMTDPEGKPVGEESVGLPVEVAGYKSERLPVDAMEIWWLPKDTTFGKRKYVAADGFQVQASVVVMGTDRGSIHKPQICLTGQGWKIEESETVVIAMERPWRYDLEVMQLMAGKTAQLAGGQSVRARGIYLYWFVGDGQLTAHHGERMWWMARDLIREGVLQRWAYVSFFSTCYPGEEEQTLQRMKELIRATVPEFQLASGRGAARLH